MTRWGILGTGAVAADFAAAIRLVPDAELVAVASHARARADAFAKASGARRGHEGRDALARDREVDVVYVATPNESHEQDAMALLEAGKPVVCEKPFATSGADARAIVELARTRGLFCMEAMWMRFAPIWRDILSLVTAGEIGDVTSVVAQLGWAFPPGHRVLAPSPGSGVLFDLGVYPISFAMRILGTPTSVAGHAVLDDNGIDTQVAATLGFEGGRQAIIHASARGPTTNDATIHGTDGMITVHAPLYCPESITIVRSRRAEVDRPSTRIGPPRLSRLRSSSLARVASAVVAQRRARTIRRAVLGRGYAHEIEAVGRCLREGEREATAMPLDESVAVAEVLDALRARWITQGGGGR